MNLEEMSKEDLISHARSLKAANTNMKNKRIGDKVQMMFLQRTIRLLSMKLQQWEKGCSKRSYACIGRKHNRSISTLKKNHNRRNVAPI